MFEKLIRRIETEGSRVRATFSVESLAKWSFFAGPTQVGGIKTNLSPKFVLILSWLGWYCIYPGRVRCFSLTELLFGKERSKNRVLCQKTGFKSEHGEYAATYNLVLLEKIKFRARFKWWRYVDGLCISAERVMDGKTLPVHYENGSVVVLRWPIPGSIALPEKWPEYKASDFIGEQEELDALLRASKMSEFQAAIMASKGQFKHFPKTKC